MMILKVSRYFPVYFCRVLFPSGTRKHFLFLCSLSLKELKAKEREGIAKKDNLVKHPVLNAATNFFVTFG